MPQPTTANPTTASPSSSASSSTAVSSTTLAARSKLHHSQRHSRHHHHHHHAKLQDENILPPSPSSSPDPFDFATDHYKTQLSPQPKRFPLKNLRRKSPQGNLHDAASHPNIQIPVRQRRHDGPEDPQPVNIADLQAKISLLTKNIQSAGAALKKADDEKSAWKTRATTLEHRNRAIGKENRDLKVRNAELEHGITATKKPTDNSDGGEPRRKRRESPSIANDSEESRAVRALISHHWNAQMELATAAGKDTDWCGCVASKTLRSILKDGSNKTSPMLQAKGFEDVAKGSPSGSNKKLQEPLSEKMSELNLHTAPQQPKPRPEVQDDGRKKRKEALKRKIKEVRGYVEGLRRENDVLESLLTSDDAITSVKSSRRNEETKSRRSKKHDK
ncbi:hypothetical protein TWF694_010754 [Orbilia ellipsospora]|uniref:BZIP domain-containing protein n=1 Tax=Orbilia ellipsospora TaxID=2528407 RepID=A0AAV9X9K1_9PEZI